MARTTALAAILLAAIGFKVWLASSVPIDALATASLDDRLFVDQAFEIATTGRAGPYDERTLIKGPVFPWFLAASHRLGLPLRASETALYAAAGALFFVSLAPLVRRKDLLAIAFVGYLLHPAFPVTARILRDNLYVALTVSVVAFAIGLIVRRDRRPRTRAAWALGLGTTSALFAMTRQEAFWLVPGLVVLLAPAVLPLRGFSRHRLFALWDVALAILVGIAAITGVAIAHRARYGVAAVTELQHPAFRSAYTDLLRVEPSAARRYVPVPRSARDSLYRVSPRFAELRPHLEDGAWLDVSCRTIPETCGDIGGGWFVWALRSAVARAGHHASGPSAMRYYRELSREIDLACRTEELRCRSRWAARAAILGRVGEPRPILTSLGRAWLQAIGRPAFHLSFGRSEGDERGLERFAAIAGMALSPPERPAGRRAPTRRIRHLLAFVYRYLLVVLAAPACLALAGRPKAIAPARPELRWIGLGLLVAVTTRLLLLALLDAAAFPAVQPTYVGPGYPLLYLLEAVLLIALIERRGRENAVARSR